MANIYKGALELIGGTPLLEATNIEKAHGLEARLLFKLEYFNPAGSVKDRIAKSIDRRCRRKRLIKRRFCDHRADIR